MVKHDIIVVKFGGSCLSTPVNVLAAAKKIATEVKKKKKIIVVVSALTGVTDSLLNAAKESTLNTISNEDLDEILSMGERTSARLMASALKSLGVQAIGIEPSSNLWPIRTDSNYGNAEVDLELTKKEVNDKIKPLLDDGKVPVIPGFIGVSPEGKITTLGRGGSDISAVVLGNCIDAAEVVFVKDVEGVLSADPKKVIAPQKIDSLEAEEAYSLTLAGAKILHPKALKYKTNSTIIRVVGFNDANLNGGTIIRGELKPDLQTTLHNESLSMLTIIGQEVSASKNVLRILSEASARNTNVLGVTLAPSSLLLYIQNPSDLVQHLHEMIKNEGIAKAIHCFDSLAMIVISGHELERIPGIVNVVTAPLARNSINLYGVMTISSSVRVFVPWKDREKALTLINNSLNKFKEQKVDG